MSNLPERWLTNATVVLANGCVRLLLLKVSIEFGAIFTPSLVTSVLKVNKRKVLDQRVISAVELASGGPTAKLPVLWNQPDYKEYWDDVNGGFLNPRLVREARLLELDWIKKERVCDYCSRTEAEEKGIKPIPLIWVDTNKVFKNSPFVRSRICVRKCKKGRNPVESLEPEQLFSATPPLEALELLCSLKVSMKTSRRGNPLKLAHFDISQEHFKPKARREIYVELPDEDPMKQKGFVGLLCVPCMERRIPRTCGRKTTPGHLPSAVTRLAGPTLQCFTLIVKMVACWCMAMTSSCLQMMERSKPWNSYSRASTR